MSFSIFEPAQANQTNTWPIRGSVREYGVLREFGVFSLKLERQGELTNKSCEITDLDLIHPGFTQVPFPGSDSRIGHSSGKEKNT